MLALDVSLKRLSNQNFTIRDGDVIKVYPVLPGRVNTVTLSGNVRRPGEFQWYKGMRVSDLVKRGEGILPNTYFKYALIRRLTGPEKTVHFLQVNLGDALSSPHMAQGDIALQPKDELDIYNLDDIRDLPVGSGQWRGPHAGRVRAQSGHEGQRPGLYGRRFEGRRLPGSGGIGALRGYLSAARPSAAI